VAVSPPHARRLGLAEAAFRSLPERFRGAPAGLDATLHFVLDDLGHTWEVRVRSEGVQVRRGATGRRPDARVTTDAPTWLRVHHAELSGVEAFAQRRLQARGDLDLAIRFEGLFRRPDGGDPLSHVHDVDVDGLRISALSMGRGPDVLLLHGLGASKTSYVDTLAALSRDYRVHALDLPGFGASAKPAVAPYSARWFADVVVGWLDAVRIGRVHLVGNSMGGRIALEVGLDQPRRIGSIGLLCPAVAFVRRRELWPLVRLARPELAVVPHHFARHMIKATFRDMFASPEFVDPAFADLAVEEFRRVYSSAGARCAFLASARNIYLDRPFGRHGFYPRLAELQPRSLFVWGTHDRLVPPGFRRHVEQWLPRAEHVLLEQCGHVPQIERPEQTNGLLRRLFASTDALLAPHHLAPGTHHAERADEAAA
jgi:pimeloyl-ACP methyl ester carboxylesterase/putative sterol carrier protein